MQEFLAKYKIKSQRIAVAVSGGADSLALVLMVKEQLAVFGYEIIALTVSHGLRPSSEEEARYVAKIMQQYGIEHHILYWRGTKPTTGVEEAARLARYKLLTEWCRQNSVGVLLTAHHLQDQAETFLMRLQRGSGLEGLCCMREITERDGVLILRPLLYCAPEIMQNYLQQKGIEWVKDESNSDTRYLRNRIRAFLPQLENETQISTECLALTAKRLQSAEDYIEQQTDAVFGGQVQSINDVVYYFKYADFLNWHDEIKFRILARLCRREYIPRAERLLNAITQMRKLPFAGLTLGGKEIFKAYDKIWVVPELKAKRKPSREMWKNFVQENPQYQNQRIPHKARVAILQQTEGIDDL
ncbi:MAG: tRNA lysidine(34) synthetase TilS [Alphaproteobacteria bacterium]|nr:tRNA lysidine(34) synthetase TilS [Alphaproteobacteria bacterium]